MGLCNKFFNVLMFFFCFLFFFFFNFLLKNEAHGTGKVDLEDSYHIGIVYFTSFFFSWFLLFF
jgi:hypothetical protein